MGPGRSAVSLLSRSWRVGNADIPHRNLSLRPSQTPYLDPEQLQLVEAAAREFQFRIPSVAAASDPPGKTICTKPATSRRNADTKIMLPNSFAEALLSHLRARRRLGERTGSHESGPLERVAVAASKVTSGLELAS